MKVQVSEKILQLKKAIVIYVSLLLARRGPIGDSVELDHHIPAQADHPFRAKLTSAFRAKLTTPNT